MRLCLIRHGETVFNREDRMQGAREIELTAGGREEAVRLGHLLRSEHFHPARLVSSPVRRALATAQGLGFGTPIDPDPAFAARSLGELEGLTRAQIRDRFPGTLERLFEWDYVPPGAEESLRALFHRADHRLVRLTEGTIGDDGLLTVVTHSGVLEALIRGWLHLGSGDRQPYKLRNACALIFHRSTLGWEHQKTLAAGTDDRIDAA
jgi:probable phosphoglycerate mutase